MKTEREKMNGHGPEMLNDHRHGNSVLITSEKEKKLSFAGLAATKIN